MGGQAREKEGGICLPVFRRALGAGQREVTWTREATTTGCVRDLILLLLRGGIKSLMVVEEDEMLC